jgi:hypothetical protein
VTGTNFILATDLSGTLEISQTPANGSALLMGTNVVVIVASDVFSNIAYSTNTIVVQDQTPPQIITSPQSQTNLVGATANFSVGAAACTPLAFQWSFNNVALTDETNSTLILSNLTAAAAGNYAVVVTATGGSVTSAAAALTVDLISTSLTLDSSANPSGSKDNVSFTATVWPINATGSIQFFTNDVAFDTETIIAGEVVSTDISSLPRGTNSITAIYSGDANNLSSTNLLLQIVTNHPPVAVSAFYTNIPGFCVSIALADLATNWTDVDDDAISLAEVSVSTNGITLTNNGAALVYFNSNNIADQFVCTISDGFGGTNFQTVAIAPAPPVSSAPLITGVVSNPGGSFNLSLAGAPGHTYVLETTTDLISLGDWLPVATNTLGTNGLWQFNDDQATNFVQRFYRLKLLP